MSREKNELCFLKILGSHGKALTTSQLLEATDLFPELCSGCKSGNDVISAGLRLLEKNQINRTAGKGGFLWSLK